MELTTPALLEAVLFSSGEAVQKKKIIELLSLTPPQLLEAIEVLRTALKGHGLLLVETETEIELRTAPGASDIVAQYRESELSRDIGKASLETLAMIVYKGSASRSDIDWVRGVNSAAALRSLTLRGLIEKTEDPDDKRKVRYLATVEALAHLGVDSKKSLPRYNEFSKTLEEQEQTFIGNTPV